MTILSKSQTDSLSTDEHYAGFWRRLAASLIDTVFMFFFLLLIHALIFGDTGLQITVNNGWVNVQSNNGIIEQLLVILFTVIMWTKFLGTPGKLALGCHVIDAKTRKHIKPVQGVVRYLSYLISLIPLGLGFFWIGWDKKKQGFHDKIAGTIVVVDSTHLIQDESQKTVQQLMDELR